MHLLATVTELRAVAGGAALGESWKAKFDNNDWPSVERASQDFFDNYDAKEVAKSSAKVEKAMRSYIKEAAEAGINKEDVKQDIRPAEAELAREKQTHNKAVCWSLCWQQGQRGSDTCLQQVEDMVTNGLTSEHVCPALWSEARKLMAR